MGNRINKFIQGASRLPGQLIGSVLNPLTSGLESKVFGNAYEGLSSNLKNIPTIMSKIQGVTPTADIPIPYDTAILAGTADAYPDSSELPNRLGNRFNRFAQEAIRLQGTYDAEVLAGRADAYPN